MRGLLISSVRTGRASGMLVALARASNSSLRFSRLGLGTFVYLRSQHTENWGEAGLLTA